MKTIDQILIEACQQGKPTSDFDAMAKELVAAGLAKNYPRSAISDRIIRAAIDAGSSPVADTMGQETTGLDKAMNVAGALKKALKRLEHAA